MVLLPVPTTAGTEIVAGPASVSSNISVPLAPVVMEVVRLVAASWLKVIEPTVWGPSAVIVRLFVWAGLKLLAALLNVALAPMPFGMAAGFQLAMLSQVPPPCRFQTTAPDVEAVTFKLATELVTL